MIPFGTHTVTLLHKVKGVYARHIISGCSWRMRETRVLSEGVQRPLLETTCRLPENSVKPVPGDLLILGKIQAVVNSEIELVRLREQMVSNGVAAFRVNRVTDNTNGAPLPHYAAIGE